MFQAKLKEASILKKVIDAVKDLVADVNFLCTSDGIQMQAMDSAHVCLICFTLLAEGFTEYECSEDFTLGLNMSTLSKILRCAENSDMLTLSAKPDGDTIDITFESPNGLRQSTFELRRMDIDAEQIEIPETEYQCSLKMPCNQFQKLIRDLSTISESTKIHMKSSVISFSVTTETSGNAKMTVHEDRTCKREEEQTLIETDEPDREVTQMFALRYLSYFAKTTGIADQVGMYMRDGMPLYITYDMGDVGSIGYYLAPKLVDD
jgi:proliferating cell nuclear antigen